MTYRARSSRADFLKPSSCSPAVLKRDCMLFSTLSKSIRALLSNVATLNDDGEDEVRLRMT